jgi:hypothetical protein
MEEEGLQICLDDGLEIVSTEGFIRLFKVRQVGGVGGELAGQINYMEFDDAM